MARPGPAAGRLARPRGGAGAGPGGAARSGHRVVGPQPGPRGAARLPAGHRGRFAAAGRTSILAGGAVAMAVLVALDTAARAWPAWFPVRLASMPGDPRWPSSLAWTVGLSLAIVAAALALEARGGTRAGLPGRRHAARRWRAAELEVRP